MCQVRLQFYSTSLTIEFHLLTTITNIFFKCFIIFDWFDRCQQEVTTGLQAKQFIYAMINYCNIAYFFRGIVQYFRHINTIPYPASGEVVWKFKVICHSGIMHKSFKLFICWDERRKDINCLRRITIPNSGFNASKNVFFI